MYQNQIYQCIWKQNLCFFFREFLSLECCGGQKLLGSLHQLLLVESKEMKEASGDELSINTFIWVTRLMFLDYCLKNWILSKLPALLNWKATNKQTFLVHTLFKIQLNHWDKAFPINNKYKMFPKWYFVAKCACQDKKKLGSLGRVKLYFHWHKLCISFSGSFFSVIICFVLILRSTFCVIMFTFSFNIVINVRVLVRWV